MPSSVSSQPGVDSPCETAAVLDPNDPVIQAHEPRNLLTLALYQVVLRIGWIFKTESVIMPAFLDLVSGQAWLRGCLPLLNRFGQSVPPVLFSRRIQIAGQKKWILAQATLAMAALFGLLAYCWAWYGRQPWMGVLFLVVYAIFFSSTGVNQLTLATLQGKLIRPQRRGRLLMISTVAGGIGAIGCAWWLLLGWLELPGGGFTYIFSFTAGCFVFAALLAIAIREPTDRYDTPPMRPKDHFVAAWTILCVDRNFRRLAIVAMLFMSVMILFPHYQALARERFAADADAIMARDLVIWVIVQNFGTSIYGVIAGPIADRRGNRVVLRTLIGLSGLTPLLAVVLGRIGGQSPESAQSLFPLVFLLVGLTPTTMRMLINYTLEISPVADHPRYLSTLGLCLAVPLCFSPLVGLLVSAIGFEPVFISGAVLVLLAALLTFRLIEPRHHDDTDSDNLGHLPEQ